MTLLIKIPMVVDSYPGLNETCLKSDDKTVLRKIIQKTEEYNKENKKGIKIFITGSSLANSYYHDIDLVVISKSHEPKNLALLVGKWVEGVVFPEEPYPAIRENEAYHGPHPQNCYRISVSRYNIIENAGYPQFDKERIRADIRTPDFDITAGKTLDDALADHNRKYVKITHKRVFDFSL